MQGFAFSLAENSFTSVELPPLFRCTFRALPNTATVETHHVEHLVQCPPSRHDHHADHDLCARCIAIHSQDHHYHDVPGANHSTVAYRLKSCTQWIEGSMHLTSSSCRAVPLPSMRIRVWFRPRPLGAAFGRSWERNSSSSQLHATRV